MRDKTILVQRKGRQAGRPGGGEEECTLDEDAAAAAAEEEGGEEEVMAAGLMDIRDMIFICAAVGGEDDEEEEEEAPEERDPIIEEQSNVVRTTKASVSQSVAHHTKSCFHPLPPAAVEMRVRPTVCRASNSRTRQQGRKEGSQTTKTMQKKPMHTGGGSLAAPGCSRSTSDRILLTTSHTPSTDDLGRRKEEGEEQMKGEVGRKERKRKKSERSVETVDSVLRCVLSVC